MRQMTRIGTLLLIAIVVGFGTVPAVQAQETADLALTKTLFTGGSIYAGDQVIWNLTLTNNGPDGATGIQVTEDMTGLGESTLDLIEAGEGSTYADPVWAVPVLGNGETATLNLTLTLAGNGDLENRASITAADQEDPDETNNQVSSPLAVGQSLTAEIDVKPETMNLGSRGLFTVFIHLGEDYPLGEITLGEEGITCNGATPKKIHVNQKDGGTLMIKYRRQDLTVPEPDPEPDTETATGEEVAEEEEDTDTGETLTITCEGTILAGGETVEVTGSDTVRITGEKKKGLDALLAGFLDTVLPLDEESEDGTDDGTATATDTTTPALDQDRNRGQLKKGGGDQVCTGDCTAADTPTPKGNGKKAGASDDDTVTGSQGKGNQGNGNQAVNPDDTTVPPTTGIGNGKGNGNSGEKEKGTGNGKK